MLKKNILPRLFTFELEGNTIELEDPNPAFNTQAVLNFFANSYPILTTANIQEPIFKDDKMVYTFKSTLGTKG